MCHTSLYLSAASQSVTTYCGEKLMSGTTCIITRLNTHNTLWGYSQGEPPFICMWSQAASTIPVAGIFGGIFGWIPRWDLWKGFRKVPDRTLPDEGVAPGALGRTPPSTPTWGGSGRRARPYVARDPQLRGGRRAGRQWFSESVSGSKPARQTCTYVDGGRQNSEDGLARAWNCRW